MQMEPLEFLVTVKENVNANIILIIIIATSAKKDFTISQIVKVTC